MSDDIPREWHLLLERKAIAVNYRALGERARMSHEAARRVVRGWSVRDSSIRKVAEALGVDPEKVRELRGEAPGLGPWEPPAASSLLSHDEREALSRLISLIVARGSERHGRDAAATNGAEGTSAIEAVKADPGEDHRVPRPEATGQREGDPPGLGRRE